MVWGGRIFWLSVCNLSCLRKHGLGQVGGGRGRGEIHWPGGRDKVGTLGQGRVVKNAGGGVVEGNRVAWQHWPWGRGKVRNQKALGRGRGEKHWPWGKDKVRDE